MIKAKQVLIQLPEYYLLILTIIAGYTYPFTFNPIFLGLAVVPIFQIVVRNKISGLIIASLFVLLNLYMLGALISELSEFLVFNSSAIQLLGGLSFLIVNILASSVMFYKYTRPSRETKSALSI